jgi:hypothetical protein
MARRRPTSGARARSRTRRDAPSEPDPLEVAQRQAWDELQARHRRAEDAVSRFRTDMDEATRQLRRWAAVRARSRDAEWHGYPTATGLVEVELGNQAVTVARARLRQGATLDQAVAHAVSVVEELVPEVVQRLGLMTEAWVPWKEGSQAADANRRKRIANLRAKAASTPFPEEAVAFTQKADQLAKKYGLDA